MKNSIKFMFLSAILIGAFTSCEKDIIDSNEVIIAQNENLNIFESQENNLKDLASHQESFVELWIVVNERIKNNGNLVNAYSLGQTEEELEKAFLKDIGYENNTYNDFFRVYDYSLTKYKTSLKANGLNIDDENTIIRSIRNDITTNLVVSRSCRGECDADYFVDGIKCVGLGVIPAPAGPALAIACLAANAWELSECYDNCN